MKTPRLTPRLPFRTLAALTLLACTDMANADDWFFRPLEGGPYGSGNGTSYQHAWHRDRDIVWGPGGVQPGDTLHICGTHDGGIGDQAIVVGTSGTADQPIIIDGRCPYDDNGPNEADPDSGSIFAAGRVIRDGWSYVGGGVYRRDGSGCSYTQVIEDETTRLQRIAREADGVTPAMPYADWPAGSFFQDENACAADRALYYKPSSGAPDDHVLHTGSGHAVIRINDVDHVSVRNLEIRNISTTDGAINVHNANHVSIENNTIRWAALIAIPVTGESDHGSITGNTIHDSANGIYFRNTSATGPSADHWRIADNEIYDMDQACFYCHLDSHAIGVQGSSHLVIENNHLHHLAGSGITFYSFALQRQNSNTVRYNYVHDVEDTGACWRDAPVGGLRKCRNERGIEQSSSNRDDPAVTMDNLVHHNVVANVRGIALRTKSLRGANGFTWSFLNNTVYNAGTAFFWSEYSRPDDDAADGIWREPGFRLQNNIFVNAENRFLDQVRSSRKDTAGILISNNFFHTDNPSARDLFVWDKIAYDTLGDWMAAANRGDGSRFADPMLVAPAAGDFRPQPGSPVAGAGVATAVGGGDVGAHAAMTAPGTVTDTATTDIVEPTPEPAPAPADIIEPAPDTTSTNPVTTASGGQSTTTLPKPSPAPADSTEPAPATTSADPVAPADSGQTTVALPKPSPAPASAAEPVSGPATTSTGSGTSLPASQPASTTQAAVTTAVTQAAPTPAPTPAPDPAPTVSASGISVSSPAPTRNVSSGGGGGGGGGCTVTGQDVADPTLPILCLVSLACLAGRRRGLPRSARADVDQWR